MPAGKAAPPATTPTDPTEASATTGASPASEAGPPAAFEYTAPFTTVYVAVPLTAHPATDSEPATVFDWPDGAPADGRWQPTHNPPNQAADNAGPTSTKE